MFEYVKVLLYILEKNSRIILIKREIDIFFSLSAYVFINTNNIKSENLFIYDERIILIIRCFNSIEIPVIITPKRSHFNNNIFS